MEQRFNFLFDGLTDDSASADCSQFNSCDSCISGDPALNLTRCVWQSCNNGKLTHVSYELKCILLCVFFVYSLTQTEDTSDRHVILATESDLRNNLVNYSNAGTRTVTAAVHTDISPCK